MENDDIKKCPVCGESLFKNGKRSDGRQRWKCKNKKCCYHETENAKVNTLKTNAINFFIDFLNTAKGTGDVNKSRNIKLNFRKTKFRNDKNPELIIKEIKDIRIIESLDRSKCFIIQLNDNSVDLISTKYADAEIVFKNPTPDTSRIYTKEK